MLCWPSARVISVVSGVNPPATTLVACAVADGENGSGAEHAAPWGPEVMGNAEEAPDGVPEDQVVNDALL
jgi:hypothetical protein